MASFVVITPALNVMPRIKASVASVACQRTSGIFVRHRVQLSAASSDGSREWLESSPNLELEIANDFGMYDAISRGFKSATEDYFCWLNADEQFLNGAFSFVSSAFDAFPDAGIVFGDYLIADENTVPISARREIPARLWYLKHGVNYVLSCATFFRREVWTRLGGFDLSLSCLADKEFYMRALSSGVKAVHIPHYLGVFGSTGVNLSRSPKAISEQALLRSRTGSYCSSAARAVPRMCRVVEKAFRGAYFPSRTDIALFDNDGKMSVSSNRWLSPFWRWK